MKWKIGVFINVDISTSAPALTNAFTTGLSRFACNRFLCNHF